MKPPALEAGPGALLMAAGAAADQLGWFASIPPPRMITDFELALVGVELVILAAAVRLYRGAAATAAASS